ncbi:MAG: citrate (Si)-synthase [Dehalococcoidia bacterium]|nr:citrate (Si)-synthase [Dehalococcoidia bacterium]MSQ34512.1 citrate (Si)-synthase [Dehalococcoidia bacterium]
MAAPEAVKSGLRRVIALQVVKAGSLTTEQVTLHRGLADVYLDRTETSFIDGKAGILEYRGVSIHDLAAHSTFEETAYLLLTGQFPTSKQLAEFDSQLKADRQVPAQVYDIIGHVKHAHPMDVLRTAVSALAAFDPDRNDNSPAANLRKGIRLTSQFPTIVMAHHAIRNGRKPIEPNQKLGHAANFLYMIKGEVPSLDTTALMNLDFILHAEHGVNASTFAARVVTGTSADFHGSITAAVAALSGPSHGGAAEDVMKMAMDIGDPARAAQYVKDLLASGGRVTGFGHRVYKVEDPRARHLREGVKRLSEERGEQKWYAILEATVQAMQPYARRGVHVNVDFYAGVIYHLLGVPKDLFVPVFAVGRVPGWTVQIMEQFQNNILIRPLLQYVGPRERIYIPLSQRG